MNKSLIDEIRDYWDKNLHDHEVTTEPEGSYNFYKDLENYHYEKLDYLPGLLNFSSYSAKRVLEVGCGVGIDLMNYAKQGAFVTGIDLSPKNIALAKKYFDLYEKKADLLLMNGEDMQFKNDIFDMVLAHAVLAYTPNPDLMTMEIHRVLKPGGKAILMMYHKNSWLFYFANIIKFRLGRENAPVFRTYSVDEFKNMLSIFNKVEIFYDRFPVATRIHEGIFAKIYNHILVPGFNLIPRKFVNRFGAHLIAVTYT